MKHSVNRPPTPNEDVADSFEKDELTLGEIINVKLVESGEKENLMELVRDRLVECGWKDEMRIACRAIRAMGSLFKLTQVNLWVNASQETHGIDDSSTILSEISKTSSEDMGLIKEMKSLGLPVSFQTNKEWKTRRTRSQQEKGLCLLKSGV